jgi:hypothetical protein
MGRGTLDVPFCWLSVIGGITPSRLLAYLAAPQRPGLSGDGLMQRFQLAAAVNCGRIIWYRMSALDTNSREAPWDYLR